jgi:hypothetical protein
LSGVSAEQPKPDFPLQTIQLLWLLKKNAPHAPIGLAYNLSAQGNVFTHILPHKTIFALGPKQAQIMPASTGMGSGGRGIRTQNPPGLSKTDSMPGGFACPTKAI